MATVRTSDGSGRIKELDSLRGLLAVGVLAFHLFPQALFWLWSFVDGFFVLSGFVITRLILANPLSRTTLISFYARRALRIWPVYFLALAAALAMNWLYYTKNGIPLGSIRGIPQSLFFLQFTQFYWTPYSQYFPYNYIYWFGHSWSLAVEDQFYWLWPIVTFGFRKNRVALIGICLLMIAVGAWTRFSGHLIFLLTARVDGLALGATLALLESKVTQELILRPKVRTAMARTCAVVAAGCIAILCKSYIVPNYRLADVPNLHYQNTTWLITLFAVTYAALVAILWLYRERRGLWILRIRPFLWLGERSYAIYMFHPLVQITVERAAERYGLPKGCIALATVAITLFLSDLSCRYIESRFASQRRRFPLNTAAGISAKAA